VVGTDETSQVREEKRGTRACLYSTTKTCSPYNTLISVRRFEKGRCGVAVSDSAKA